VLKGEEIRRLRELHGELELVWSHLKIDRGVNWNFNMCVSFILMLEFGYQRLASLKGSGTEIRADHLSSVHPHR
jgi:hypothetical protein